MTRSLSPEGMAALRQWEGLVLHAYDDADPPAARRRIQPGDPVRGTLTIGYGHTRTAKPGMEIDRDEAARLLAEDTADARAAVSRLVKVPLTDGQYATLVSFVFNVGVGAFTSSTLLRRLNAGEYDAVPGELARWIHQTIDGRKRVVDGLVNRRAAEAGLWAKGGFVSSAPVRPKPAAPPAISQETVAWGATVVASLGTTLAGSGPVQYALAAVIAVAALAGLWLFVAKRVRPS